MLFVLCLLTNTIAFHDEHVDDFTCQNCPHDSFCVDNARYYCPPNSTAIAFADSLEDCICNPGYNRTTQVDNQVCLVGQPPYYYYEGIQYSCPGHGHSKKVTVNSLSFKIEHCVCTPGYAGVAGSVEACEICAVNFYSDMYNATACLECSSNSQNLITGSKSIYDCKCEPGYEGQDGSACTACPAGKFKSVFGNSTCETCPENTFSHLASTSCSECPGNSTSEAESVSINNCLCNAGFSGVDGGPCVLCEVGKFKNSAANKACEFCADDTFSENEGATSCVLCSNNSAHGVGRDRCLCNAGYTQADTVDTRPDCTPCPVNTYQSGSGETSCFECDANANGPEASVTPVTCFCNAGFYDPGDDTCDSCAAGTFKEAASTPEEDGDVCSACPLYANSLPRSAASSDCICNAGYSGTLGVAVIDEITWTYDDYFDSDNAELTIPAGYDITFISPYLHPFMVMKVEEHFYLQPSDNPEVFAYPVNNNGENHRTTVHIPINYTGSLWWYCQADLSMPHGRLLWNVVNTCEACEVGFYKAYNGTAECTACEQHYYSDTSASTACESCVESLNSDGAKTDASASDSSDDCVCDPGLGYVEIRDLNDARTCTGCQPGTFATNEGCANCTNGQFSDVAGLGACKDCPANSSSYDYPHIACQCHVGYYCPASAGDEFSIQMTSGETSIVPVTQTSGCLCSACPMDTFKNYTGGAASCYACQANSVSDLASVSQEACKCAFGYRQDGPDTCVACLAGRYADTLDSITCTACGDRFYTAQSDFPWTNIGECKQCLICHNDGYDAANGGLGCGNGTATECQACPEHKSLLEAFTLDNWQAGAESCKCDAGYEPVNSSIPSTCKTCALNYFKSSVGDVQCTACPDTTVTEFQSADSLDSCVCPAGYHFGDIDGIPCLLCQPGTYKTGLSRQAVCDACTNHSTSEAGSDESSDCLCLPGFGAVGGPGTTMSLHIARWQSERGTFHGNVIAPEDETLQATSPEQVGNYDRYENKPKSVALMSQLQAYITSPCNSGDYFGSLAQMAEQLTQSPCASNYENQLYVTSGSSFHASCLFMAVDYTVDGVTHKSPAVVYLNLMKDRDNKYYQLMIKHYETESQLQSDMTQQTCFPSYSTDPLIIGGGTYQAWDYTESSIPVTLFLEPSLESSCEICPTGQQKNVTANEACSDCAVNSFAADLGTHVCEPCEAGKSTVSLTGQSYCECDAGTERESSDVLSVCQDCADGKFKAAASYDEPSCQNCSRCAANEQVDTVCDRFQNITCKACQPNSWSPPERTELGPCLCNAGYELVGSECVACPIGKARTTNYNNSIACETCQDGKFADTEAVTECEFCAAHCNGTIGGLQTPPVYLNYARMCGSDGNSACLTDGGSVSAVLDCDFCDTEKAVDGQITDQSDLQFDARNGNVPDPGCMILQQVDNYWWVDLGESRAIERIKIYGPKGYNIPGRYTIGNVLLDSMNQYGFTIRVGNNAAHATWSDLEQNPICAHNGFTGVGYSGAGSSRDESVFQDMEIIAGGIHTSTSGLAEIECIAEGRYVSIQPNEISDFEVWLGLCEIQVEGQDPVALNTYVSDECEVTRDTVCTACTPCPPGQYAIQSCGISFNNDRNDTKCDLCPAGFYCPGGTDNDGEDIKPQLCTDLSTSSAGSDSILDCQCAPGYFHNGDVCQLCLLDTYCPGDNVVENCPINAITHDVGSIYRLDCHCLSGHYRNPPEDSLNFNCSVCTPNDYCFNNSLYDCPDARMISNSGSISFKNCTCMDGYYNHGLKCEECPIDHFCFDGNVFECASREWTNNLQRQSKCVCRPGLFRSEEICTFCNENFYCDGTDDIQQQCPLNSISYANSTTLQQCLCVPGYEHIHAQNYTLAHTCVSCENGKFKDKHGMHLCTPCRKCLAINNIYELHSCTLVHDTVCDSCETCHKNHPDDNPRFVQTPCADHQNAICGPCSTCNFTNQYERIQCSPETGDTVCTDIIKTSEQCLSGQYRGSHSMYSQSICTACQFHDTKYHGMTLHVASGPGLEYDNAYSCPIQCLGNSVLRDVSDMSLGCRSCEAGNVLLRNIHVVTDTAGNKVNCSFTCRNGYEYDPARDDCFVSSLESSENNKFDHTLEISNFQHEIDGFSLRVTHTNHGKFMVVIGPSEPSDCRKNFCCQSNLWRVSTLEQAGLNPSIHSDSCSKSNELNKVSSTQIDLNTLSFNVSDSIVNEVGTCTNAANGTVSCLFTVSMIDLILRKSISRQIVIQTKHSVQYAFVNNPQKYIPLSFLQADILFLYNVSEIPYFQMTLQLKSDTDMHISTRVSGLNQLNKEMLQPCPRLSNSIGVIYQNVSESVPVSKNEIVTLVSYWYGTANRFYENEITFSHFLSYLTLQIGGPESSNIMDVAVSRKLSLLNNLCHSHTHSTTLNLGHILYTAGLGQSTIKNLIDHNANFVQARGELGTMFTFLAYSELPETETISLERGIAVHLSKANLLTTTELNQAVNFSSSSNFELTPSFRTKCFNKRPNCVYGYFNNLYNSNPIFILNNCSEYNQKQAQKWISSQMGATNDQGHISSLCSVIDSLHSFSTKAFMINSMSFVDKRNAIWNTYQNWTSPGTSTNVWVKFRFDTPV